MNLCIVSIKDRATDSFSRPVFVSAPGQAVRSFSDEVNRAGDGNEINRHPDDFDLYLLGYFDDTRGAFDACEPSLLARGKDVILPKD